MRGRTCPWLAALVLACCAALAAEEPQQAKEFKSAKRGIQQQLKSRKPEARLAAIRKLADYPTAEAAKVLIQMGFGSQDDEVRKASYIIITPFDVFSRAFCPAIAVAGGWLLARG